MKPFMAAPQSPSRNAALSYVARGLHVLPLHGIHEGACTCKTRDCPNAGKHPIGALVPNGLNDASSDPATVRGWFTTYPNANVGIRTGPESGVFVLDVDARHGGHFNLEDIESTHGKLPYSHRARTGSGGGSMHIYFRYPESRAVPNSTDRLGRGLDIRGKGGYVVAPPSRHLSGGTYEWLDEDDTTLEDAPAWLLDRICPAKPATEAPEPPHECHIPITQRKRLAREFLKTAEIAIEGHGGDNLTYRTVCRVVKKFCITDFASFMEVIKDWNIDCQPPWDEKDLKHKFDSAFKSFAWPWHSALPDIAPAPALPPESAPAAEQAPAPQDGPATPEPAAPLDLEEIAALSDDIARHQAIKDFAKSNGVASSIVQKQVQAIRREASAPKLDSWRSRLILEPAGDNLITKSCVHNARVVLSHHEAIKGKIRFNLLTQNIENHGLPLNHKPGQWTDVMTYALTAWLQPNEGIFLHSSTIDEIVRDVAMDHPYHPVKDYLEALKWDGINRVDHWLTDHCEAEDTPLHRAFARKFLISAVRRIYEPGSQADHMLILESEQGRKKSTYLRTLFSPAWFTDEVDVLGSKDSAMQLNGVWGVELAELDSMHRSETTRVKAFITRRIDRYRPPYGRHVVEMPRQCVFVGTTNKDHYLTDDTGNRRFWTVRCHRLHPELLEETRDQLWAEAYALYRSGEQPFLDREDIADAATEAQETRHVAAVDPWTEPVADIIETWHRGAPVTLSALLVKLGVDVAKQSQRDFARLGPIMRSLGFTRVKAKVDGKNKWVFRLM